MLCNYMHTHNMQVYTYSTLTYIHTPVHTYIHNVYIHTYIHTYIHVMRCILICLCAYEHWSAVAVTQCCHCITIFDMYSGFRFICKSVVYLILIKPVTQHKFLHGGSQWRVIVVNHEHITVSQNNTSPGLRDIAEFVQDGGWIQYASTVTAPRHS